LSNNLFQNNTVHAYANVCPAVGFSWSSTGNTYFGPNITRNNTFICTFITGHTNNECIGFRASGYQYFVNPAVSGSCSISGTSNPCSPDNGLMSYSDFIQGDSADVYIYYAGSPTWTCSQCTFGKASTASASWVFFSNVGGASAGTPSHPFFFIDPTFTGGASESSNDLASYASANSSKSFYYMIQFTQNLTVQNSAAAPINGAVVTYTDALSNQYTCTTNSSGQCSVIVNENKYAAVTGSYVITHYNNYSRLVTATGYNNNSASPINISSPNSVTVTMSGGVPPTFPSPTVFAIVVSALMKTLGGIL
jgi:hypothetical protein